MNHLEGSSIGVGAGIKGRPSRGEGPGREGEWHMGQQIFLAVCNGLSCVSQIPVLKP